MLDIHPIRPDEVDSMDPRNCHAIADYARVSLNGA